MTCCRRLSGTLGPLAFLTTPVQELFRTAGVNLTSWARFKLGSSVCQWQREAFADSCKSLRSMPPAATPEAYRHFVGVMTTAAEAVFKPPSVPDIVPGLVSSAANVLHTLVKAHPRWLNAPLVRKVVAACKAVQQAWDIVGLERSFEVIPLARPGGVTGPSKSDYRRLMRKPFTARIEPTQFALHASSSVADLLRVLHDYIWFSFFRRRRVCLVVDDVQHVYGSVVHDTLRCLLRLAGFPAAVVDMLVLATTEAIVHMGGSGGVNEALARLLAGVA